MNPEIFLESWNGFGMLYVPMCRVLYFRLKSPHLSPKVAASRHSLSHSSTEMSEEKIDDLIEGLQNEVVQNRQVERVLQQQFNGARQNLNGAREKVRQTEENLRAAVKAKEAAARKARFVQEIDNPCFICQEAFSEAVGTASFNVVSFRCRCTGNARMVHLHCWAQFRSGQEKCGSCSSPVHLVDEEGNEVQVTVRRVDPRSHYPVGS